jgi:hypothetical protein
MLNAHQIYELFTLLHKEFVTDEEWRYILTQTDTDAQVHSSLVGK